jgi:hypothetical protein
MVVGFTTTYTISAYHHYKVTKYLYKATITKKARNLNIRHIKYFHEKNAMIYNMLGKINYRNTLNTNK